MTPRLSIIIPHKRQPVNNEALDLCVSMLWDNTVNDFELIIDTESPKDPYQIWNEISNTARGDVLVFTNTDVLMAPAWDVNFVNYFIMNPGAENAILVGYLVECGAIGVAPQNLQKDFGKWPRMFNRMGFEKYATQFANKVPTIKEERGWYMPCAVSKEWFKSTGGFDTTLPFPNPNDIIFWEKCIKEFGTKLYRVNSWAYHFQNLTGRENGRV